MPALDRWGQNRHSAFWWILMTSFQVKILALFRPQDLVKNCRCNLRVVKNPNLNAGIGEPWAGQSNDSESPELIVNLDVSDFCENFGFVLPIGSENKGLPCSARFRRSHLCTTAGKRGTRWTIAVFYLYPGMGDPWAGQSNEMLFPDCIWNLIISVWRENFGFEDPTGSEISTKKPSKCCIIPECGNRGSLSWASQCKRQTLFLFKNTQRLWYCRKLGFGRAYWFCTRESKKMSNIRCLDKYSTWI